MNRSNIREPPPVNLKERIAALQQRNVSSSHRPTSPPPVATSSLGTASGGLRDKIAKFEKKGGVPVPRGSFGLGAPPVSEHGPPRRRGELYGNRIPGPVRPSGGGPPSRSTSPLPSAYTSPTGGRSVSLSALDFDDGADTDDLSTPNTPVVSPPSELPSSDASPTSFHLVDHSGYKLPVSRSTAFADALDIARKAEIMSEKSDARATSLSPPTAPSTLPMIGDPEDVQIYDTPPAIVISSDDAPPDPCPIPRLEASPPESRPVTLEPVLAISEASSSEEELTLSSTSEVASEVPATSDEALDIIGTPPSTVSEIEHTTGTSPSILVPLPEPVGAVETEPAHPVADTGVDDCIETTPRVQSPTHTPQPTGDDVPFLPQTPPAQESVLGALTVADIHEVSPPLTIIVEPLMPLVQGPVQSVLVPADSYQVSPPTITIEPSAPQPITTDASGKSSGDKDQENDDNVLVVAEELKRTPESPLARLAYDSPESPSASPTPSPSPSPRPDRWTLLDMQPINPSARPVSMIEAVPSQIAFAHRISPATSRGVPMFIPAPPRQDPDIFAEPSPTREAEQTDFGTVSLHKPSHSFSHPHTYVSHSHSSGRDVDGARKSSTFSAVVHTKTQEIPASSSISRKPPETPQMSRVKHSSTVEPPPSPGYGDLAMLLQEAALLEESLSNGELPGDAARDEIKKQQEQQKVDEAAAQVKADELERSRAAAVPQRPAQPDLVATKPKFRNPLRSKSTFRRDPSSETHRPSRAQDNRARSASYSDSTQPAPPPEPPIVLAPKELMSVPEANDDSDQIIAQSPSDEDIPPTPPPKSPRPRYFSGLRRLASSSRSSYIMPGAYPRHSISTSSEISSEDSMPVVTPPDHSLEFTGSGSGSMADFGQGAGNGSGSGVLWPSLSPRKNGGSLSRATSFAEKIWHRKRTKSGASTISTSEIAGEYGSVSLSHPHSWYTSADRIAAEASTEPLPQIVFPIAPTVTLTSQEHIIVSPAGSTSLSVRNSPSQSSLGAGVAGAPSLPLLLPRHEHSSDRLDPSTRPPSWISVASTGSSSMPSPTFDQDFFDSFPSVPQAAPRPPSTSALHTPLHDRICP